MLCASCLAGGEGGWSVQRRCRGATGVGQRCHGCRPKVPRVSAKGVGRGAAGCFCQSIVLEQEYQEYEVISTSKRVNKHQPLFCRTDQLSCAGMGMGMGMEMEMGRPSLPACRLSLPARAITCLPSCKFV